MYEDSGYNQNFAQSAPMSMMDIMYTTTFGNGSFVIQPPSPDEVGQGFPVIPYLSIEALFYQQQASNPVSAPINTMSGAHIGQQVISGQYTMQDSNRTSRYSMGFSQQ